MERASVRALALELVVERFVVNGEHVRVQLAACLFVAGNAATHVVVGLDRPRRADMRALADPDGLVVEGDSRRPDSKHEARLADPRQPQDALAAGAAEEDRLERRALLVF